MTIVGMDQQLDVAVPLGCGHASLVSPIEGVKTSIDRLTHDRTRPDTVVFGFEDQSQGPRLGDDGTAQHSTPGLREWIAVAFEQRVDDDGTFGVGHHVSVTDLIAQDGHLLQTRLHQPAVAQALGLTA